MFGETNFTRIDSDFPRVGGCMRMSYLLGVMESGSPGVLEPKSMESFFPAPNLAARAGYEG